jgi:hypothetical protein
MSEVCMQYSRLGRARIPSNLVIPVTHGFCIKFVTVNKNELIG